MSTTDKKPFVPFVSLKPVKDKTGRGIQLNYGISVKFKEPVEGRISCYIPSLDIYFSLSEGSSINDKAGTLSKLYFDHFFLHTKGGVKKLILELHKLGFRSNDDYAFLIHKLSKQKFISAKFKAGDKELPKEFSRAREITQEATMEVAF
jgi:hypothetical protein